MDHGDDSRLRALVREDVPAVVELAWNAGWNQAPADWQRMVELEPGGCFCIEAGGQIVATATLLCFGTELAWLGMVLTHRDHQRRGYARRLCEATLEVADARGVRCVKLDATDQGRPLYQSLGFVDEQPIERWRREEVPATTACPRVPFDAALDREAFGADRSRFLASLGWSSNREGYRAHYLGPVVTRDRSYAAKVIPEIVNSVARPWFWDLLPNQEHAAAIAEDLGFTPVRRLTRMVRGRQIERNDSLVYAIGGFEAG